MGNCQCAEYISMCPSCKEEQRRDDRISALEERMRELEAKVAALSEEKEVDTPKGKK